MELSPEVLRLFLDRSLDLLCTASTEGYLTWVSPSWERTLGWSAEELTSRPFVEFVHPDDLQATLEAVATLEKGEPVAHFVNRYQTRQGGWVWLEWMTQPVEAGQLVCVVRDVSDRMARQRVREELLQQLLLAEEMAAVGHWRVDVSEGRVWWSPQVFVIHGRDPELGEPALDDAIAYYHPDDRAQVQAHVEAALAHGTPWDFELRLIRDDGSERLVRSLGRVAERPGAPGALFGVFQDITDSRRVQRRLREAEKLASVGTLAASVAHEINNPLSYVHLNSVVLHEELTRHAQLAPSDDADELVELVDDVRDGVERIQRIVAGLKGFSATRDAQRVDLAIGDVVEAAVRLCRNELGHSAELVVEPLAAPRFVHGHEGQLVQVLVNLLMNAGHAVLGADRAHIVVRTRHRADEVVVEVEDDGVGMSEAVRARVMEPFFTTKAKSVGTGLGLFVSQGIAEAHGGRLQLISEEGQGTTAQLWLPQVASSQAREVESATDEPPAEAARVLLIDDQPKVARSLARALRPHQVEVITDPRQAVGVLRQKGEDFDLVVCDLMMPELRGEDVYEAVSPAVRRRMVFMTGGAFTPGAEDFAERMQGRVLAKPPDRDRLRRMIEAAKLFGRS